MRAISKQDFINACNGIDGDDFIREAHLYLQTIKSGSDLNDFVGVLGGVAKLKNIHSSSQLYAVCYLLRDKVYELLLSQGDVPDNNIIYLYNIYRLCNLTEDSRFTAYEHFIEQNLYADGISDTESVFLITLGFFASMANSRADSYEKFLSSTMKLNFMEISHIGFSISITEFINYSDIDIKETFEVLKKVWNKEYYFALNKTSRRSIFNWSLHSLWGVDKYFNHPDWTIFYSQWKEIFYEHISRDECNEAMYVHFFIYHKMGNSFQTQEEWKMFNDDIDRPAAKYYNEWALKTKLPICKTEQNEGKKIIGFLWDRVVENSPFKVAYSLWKALYESSEFRSKFEIKVYLMGYFEKSNNDQECMDNIRRLGVEIFDGAEPFYADGFYHSHLDKAIYVRQKMIDDGVDIMVHGGSYDINDFLVSTRTAPKQIYWSHGNAFYNIIGIDEKISHTTAIYHVNDFNFFSIPMDTDRFYNPQISRSIIDSERNIYPRNVVILGSIGRLLKVNSDSYLKTIAKIMLQNKNTIYIAAGAGNQDEIIRKTKQLGISDRFYMPGFVDPHIYGHIIDLWLDTFPHAQGESMMEFIAKKKPIVALNINGARGAYDEIHIVSSEESYVEVASKLVQDSDFREKVANRLYDLLMEGLKKAQNELVLRFMSYCAVKSFPKRIAIELTPKCNLICKPCPRHYIDEHDGFMDEKLFKKLVDEIENISADSMVLPFWRGESCLHPNFVELLTYALDKNLRISISTNGHFVGNELNSIFYRSEFVNISLHTDVGFKNAIKLIQNKPSTSNTKFQISFIDSEPNVKKYLDEIVNDDDLKGFDSVRLYAEHSIEGEFGKSLKSKELELRRFCPKLTDTIVIGWNGSYSRCSHIWNPEDDINLNYKTIQEVWKSQGMNNIRANYPDNMCLPCNQWTGRTNGQEWKKVDSEVVHVRFGA